MNSLDMRKLEPDGGSNRLWAICKDKDYRELLIATAIMYGGAYTSNVHISHGNKQIRYRPYGAEYGTHTLLEFSGPEDRVMWVQIGHFDEFLKTKGRRHE